MPMRLSGLFGQAYLLLKNFLKIKNLRRFQNAVLPRERGKHHQLSNEKGGENVEPNRREFYKQCAFQKFCNTVLHNEACELTKSCTGIRQGSYLFRLALRRSAAASYRLMNISNGKLPKPSLRKPGRKSRRSCFLKQSVLCRKKSAKPYSCTISRE